MDKKKRLLSSDDAVPAKGQHRSPCGDCPFARESLPGWLGGGTAEGFLAAAHGEVRMACHTLGGAQCAGGGIYRGNICKKPRDGSLLVLPADREAVFATPMQFSEHHIKAEEGDDDE